MRLRGAGHAPALASAEPPRLPEVLLTTTAASATPDEVLPMRTRLVSARLLTLLALLRSSAELLYGREIGLTELNRRILSLLGRFGGLTSVELVALTGQEKAQISRAVSMLSADGLIARTSLRAPVTLTPAGLLLHDRVMTLAEGRNATLTRGMAAAELEHFGAMTARLIDRAALLLMQERESEGDLGSEGTVDDPSTASPMPERLRAVAHGSAPRRLVAPPLITLSAYLSRSATIAYRRETGLSNFTWRVMAQIGEHQPVTLAALIGLLYRDKSQVGRAVKSLEGDGLICRAFPTRHRDVMLACTPKGDTLYAGMCESARWRDDFLFAGFASDERDAYIASLETFTANSERLLAQERAVC